MNREDKNQVIADLKGKLEENPHFYLTDISEMTVEDSNKLRGAFHEQGIRIEVVKNTLLKKAMESAEADYSPFYDVLKGATSIMFTEVGNVPAKVIEKFRKSSEKPILKGAFVEECVYIGDDQIKVLSSIKSKMSLSETSFHCYNRLLKTLSVALREVDQNFQESLKRCLRRQIKLNY